MEPRVSQRLAPFGTSIFAEMTALAVKHGATNLAQGFPDFDGPEAVKAAAIEAIRAGHSQYARMIGVPALNKAIADSWSARGFGEIDGETWVTVTTGCTQAIPSAMLGLLNPGDEIVLFEPFYDSYRAVVALAGAIPKFVSLRPPREFWGGAGSVAAQFAFDPEELKRAFTNKTRAILVNTPHNPTGKVFTREELTLISELCQRHGAIAITDEVYEHLVYDPTLPHVPLATLPGMRDRTVTMSSMGKTFSLTGWKIGWVIAPPHLTAGVRAAHQFLTFGAATPLQHAAAVAMREGQACIDEVVALYRSNREYMLNVLREIGFGVYAPAGSYFIMADHSAFGLGDDRAFARHLVERVGVAAIPPSPFYENPEPARRLVRFAFCKKRTTLEAAAAKLRQLRK
jgi:aspartate/methionine/tyrosine aminotransferase